MSHIDEDQGIVEVINALNDRTWKTRRQASDALIEIGKPAVLPLMAAIKQNIFTYVTFPEAIRTLGSIGDVQAVDLLVEVLEGENVHAAQEAARGLGHIGSPQATQPLIEAFRHDWHDDETITAWQEASKALAVIGQPALPALLAALNDESSTVRQGAIDALGQLQDSQAVPALINMLNDGERAVREGAIEALGQIGDQQALRPLMALLSSDEDWHVRYRACYALGDIGEISVYEALISVLHDAEPEVRRAAVVNLGRMLGMGLPRLVPDAHPERRHTSTENLKRTQREHTLTLLLEALSDLYRGWSGVPIRRSNSGRKTSSLLPCVKNSMGLHPNISFLTQRCCYSILFAVGKTGAGMPCHTPRRNISDSLYSLLLSLARFSLIFLKWEKYPLFQSNKKPSCWNLRDLWPHKHTISLLPVDYASLLTTH